MSSSREDSFSDELKGLGGIIAVLSTPTAISSSSSFIRSVIPNALKSTKKPSPLFEELRRMYLNNASFGDTRRIDSYTPSSKPLSWRRFAEVLNSTKEPHMRVTETGTEIYNVGNKTNFDSGILAHEMGHAQKLTDVRQKGNRALAKYTIRNRLLHNFGQYAALATLGAIPRLSDDAENIGVVGSSALMATAIPDELRASYRGSKLLSEAAKNTGTKLSLLKRLSSFKGVPSYVAGATAPILALQAYRHFTKKSSLNNRYYEGEGISGYMNPWNVANPKRLYFNRDNAANLGIVAGTGLAGRVVGGIAGTRIGRRIGKHNVAAMKPKPAVPMVNNVNTPALKDSTQYAVNRRVIPKLKRGDRLIRSIGRIGGSRGRMIGTGLGLTLGYLGLKRKERKPSILDFNNWIKR